VAVAGFLESPMALGRESEWGRGRGSSPQNVDEAGGSGSACTCGRACGQSVESGGSMAGAVGPGLGVAMTEEERTTAVAILAGHIDELEQAERDGDDVPWDDIASGGVEVIVGGATGELWLAHLWMEGVPADLRVIDRVGGVRRGDLIGTVGPATLCADEIVRRLLTLEFDELGAS
jgi:hypothetical protein